MRIAVTLIAVVGNSQAAIVQNLAGPHHLSYVYVGNGLTTSTVDGNTLVAYEPPDNHQGDGMNMLFGDGHCEWLTPDRLKEDLAHRSTTQSTTQP
jgi:prepilin-type processing-associated H-X9-DG protein